MRNPSNIQIKNGQLIDKYNRTFKIDWKQFKKIRGKKEINIISITKLDK